MAGFGRAQRVPIGIGEYADEKAGGMRLLPLYFAAVAIGLGAALGMSGSLDWGSGETFRPSSVGVIGVATLPADLALPFGPGQPALTHGDVFVPDFQVVMTPGGEVAPALEATVVELTAPPATVPVPAAPVSAPAPSAQPSAPPVQAQPAVVSQTAKPNFYLPEARGGPATDLEQRLLSGINAERTAAGLAPYTLNAGLTKIARTRSQQLLDQDYFGHVDPYGYSMYTELLTHFGFRYAWAGENLALNNFALSESPERAVVTLMKSPTHRANILANDFFQVGIGEVTAADGRHFYAIIFIG